MMQIPEHVQNFVAGRSANASSGDTIPNIEPATGQVIGTLPDSTAADVQAAMQAAHDAWPSWAGLPAAERSAHLLAIARGIEENLEAFARAESIDTGKPLALARSVDIPRAVLNFRFFATAILHTESQTHFTDARALNYTLRQPLGVVGLISPWNLPLYLLSWKIAPAIAIGNTAIAKPSELSPLTVHMLCAVCGEVGLPDGVLNIVHGRGATAGAALVEHPQIKAISFTGGTVTGATIARTAGPMFKKLALEMGGKNPTIVCADVDLEEVVPQIVRASFANQGQICLCGSRILVEHSIMDDFIERFIAITQQRRIGDPLDEQTQHGAVISAAHREKIESYITLAQQEGGRILCGGGRPANLPQRCRDGYFLEPTVIAGLDMHCRTNQEEIFGPVVTISPFADEADALAQANASPYGLAASLWTNDLSRAHRMAAAIECGTVWVNCWLLRDLRVPFGGMKASGVGREGGEEALRFFTEPKNVCIAMR